MWNWIHFMLRFINIASTAQTSIKELRRFALSFILPANGIIDSLFYFARFILNTSVIFSFAGCVRALSTYDLRVH